MFFYILNNIFGNWRVNCYRLRNNNPKDTSCNPAHHKTTAPLDCGYKKIPII